jgi:hemolysin activation/secretion protein
VPKLAPQQQKKSIHHKKEERANIDKKIEYARSGDKHNSRTNSNGKEFIKFTKSNTLQDKKQSLNSTNNISYANASYVSHMSYHDFDASYVLMRNKFGKIGALYVEPHHKKSKTYLWVLKCLVTNMRGPKQIWVPKNKD